MKLVTQLFGQQMLIANASGCSSVCMGRHATNKETALGLAWNRSLFEYNAESNAKLPALLKKWVATYDSFAPTTPSALSECQQDHPLLCNVWKQRDLFRRRRLGLRHRLGRAGPLPEQGREHQCVGDRAGDQVRVAQQDAQQQGSGRHGDATVYTASVSLGPDYTQGAARGGRVSGTSVIMAYNYLCVRRYCL